MRSFACTWEDPSHQLDSESVSRSSRSFLVSAEHNFITARKAALAILVTIFLTTLFLSGFTLNALNFSKTGGGAQNDSFSMTRAFEYGRNRPKSFADLFQNINSMTLEFNYTSYDDGNEPSIGTTSSQLISYVVSLSPFVNGKMAYKVNLTDTYLDADDGEESALVWVEPSSSYILGVSMGNESWVGASAQQESGILSFLTTDYWLSILNSSTVVPVWANHTVSFGSTKLEATTFKGLPSFSAFQNLTITVGIIPVSGIELVLSSSYIVPGDGSGSFRILSLDLNQSS